MPQTRSATSTGAVVALIMVGGALATGVAIVLTIFRNYHSLTMIEFRASTVYFLMECFFVGLVVGGSLVFTRPRGPLAPIGAAIAAFVAMEVGVRIGAYLAIMLSIQGFPGTGPIGDLMEPAPVKFMFYELLASLVAAGLALVKVLMSSGAGTAPAFGPGGPGQPFGAPGQPPAGAPYGAPGQPIPGQPMPGQPMPGQPMHGQPAPGQPQPPAGPGGPGGWAPGQPIDPPPSPGGQQYPGAQPPPAP
ncbi:hypothetical protein [Actinomadura sp. WAC 06369]|uniref:hypothetical protein n=1 Tax=Actinomadura sp. WAC 06369 TaxID=2203193 RepID=UPI000F766136|nr:hypothetical protein [Actinomadura sp. WAC 06369]RSN70417.1 hypothetical protein DMH08_06070 [Actinomadura sp. WAC 06369]